MKQQHYRNAIKSGLALPWWFTEQMPPLHADFLRRVVVLPDENLWHPTQIDGIELRVMEYLPGVKPRMTGQIRLHPRHSPALLGDNPDLEILVQQGELESGMGVYPAGVYLRLPLTGDQHLQSLTLNTLDPEQAELAPTRTSSKNEQHALLYVAAGQMLNSDTEQRRIDTRDESRWLPGPEDGIDVLPLHGHGTGNVMLLRWTNDRSFKPKLDPRGEEVLVLKGELYDEFSRYPTGSWIRNPIAAWQSWGASEGTVVYYKNGHLAAPDGQA